MNEAEKLLDEYLAKWYLHVDAIVLNRTDGALVRLITQIYDGETEQDADQRLQTFMHDVMPMLSEYLPSEVDISGQVGPFWTKR